MRRLPRRAADRNRRHLILRGKWQWEALATAQHARYRLTGDLAFEARVVGAPWFSGPAGDLIRTQHWKGMAAQGGSSNNDSSMLASRHKRALGVIIGEFPTPPTRRPMVVCVTGRDVHGPRDAHERSVASVETSEMRERSS